MSGVQQRSLPGVSARCRAKIPVRRRGPEPQSSGRRVIELVVGVLFLLCSVPSPPAGQVRILARHVPDGPVAQSEWCYLVFSSMPLSHSLWRPSASLQLRHTVCYTFRISFMNSCFLSLSTVSQSGRILTTGVPEAGGGCLGLLLVALMQFGSVAELVDGRQICGHGHSVKLLTRPHYQQFSRGPFFGISDRS